MAAHPLGAGGEAERYRTQVGYWITIQVQAGDLGAGGATVHLGAGQMNCAGSFAAKRRIPVVHDSYDALIADPDVDAVYNPLPNGLHGHWTVRALEAGKHVLCEKPFAANADEAAAVAVVADRALAERGLVTMEAFHYRYHPLAELMCSLVREGRIGAVRRAHEAPPIER